MHPLVPRCAVPRLLANGGEIGERARGRIGCPARVAARAMPQTVTAALAPRSFMLDFCRRWKKLNPKFGALPQARGDALALVLRLLRCEV